MTTVETGGAIERHWARNFGLPIGSLPRTGTRVVPHAALGRWSGIFLLRHENTCIVSAPEDLVGTLNRVLSGLPPNDAFGTRAIKKVAGNRVDRMVGPAWLGYADASDLRSIATAAVLLRAGDRTALMELCSAVGQEAWEHSGIQVDRPPVFGLYVDHLLVSAGMLHETHDGIQNIGLVTHPDHRGCGYATQVGAALSLHGVRLGRILQYRTLESNEPSLNVAQHLGYRPWGRTLSIHLTPAP